MISFPKSNDDITVRSLIARLEQSISIGFSIVFTLFFITHFGLFIHLPWTNKHVIPLAIATVSYSIAISYAFRVWLPNVLRTVTHTCFVAVPCLNKTKIVAFIVTFLNELGIHKIHVYLFCYCLSVLIPLYYLIMPDGVRHDMIAEPQAKALAHYVTEKDYKTIKRADIECYLTGAEKKTLGELQQAVARRQSRNFYIMVLRSYKPPTLDSTSLPNPDESTWGRVYKKADPETKILLAAIQNRALPKYLQDEWDTLFYRCDNSDEGQKWPNWEPNPDESIAWLKEHQFKQGKNK